MTLIHVIYIPGCIIVGVVLGYLLGAKAVRAEFEKQRKRAKT